VDRRNRYRIAAVASFASAVGLGVTAFFLYELDQPSSEQLHRASSPSSRVRVTPMAAQGQCRRRGGGHVLNAGIGIR
jgi:hypothetical protein